MRGSLAVGFVCLCVAPEFAYGTPVLGLDLPRELVMDVNKEPYPIVNVIADMPSRYGEGAKALAATRRQDRALEGVEASEEDSETQREKHDLQVDTKIMQRLSTIKALASHLRG